MELTRHEAAKQIGIRPSTLAFYEREELIKPVSITESGYHLFDEETIQRIKEIKTGQVEYGLSLSELRRFL